MLSRFIRTERGRRRHLETPFGPFLEGYLSHRLAQGFAVATIGANLKWVAVFGEYLAEQALAVADLGEPVVEAFAMHYRSQSRCRGTARRAPEGSTSLVEALRGSLFSLLGYLRSVGAVRPAVADDLPPYEQVLVEYMSFLREHRGLAERTGARS